MRLIRCKNLVDSYASGADSADFGLVRSLESGAPETMTMSAFFYAKVFWCLAFRVPRRPQCPDRLILTHKCFDASHSAFLGGRNVQTPDHTAPEAEVGLILVSNQNLSRGWTFRANATRKWIFQKNLQREPILVLTNTKNLFSTFWVIFSQNLKSILGFKPVTWIYYKSTIKLIFCQVFTKNSLFYGHH